MKNLSDCRILLVDDVKDNLDILVAGLKGEYKLSIAVSGAAALKNVASTPPDLILLDVMMPGMSGFEVCKHLKKDPGTKDIPIMFLTSLDDVEFKATGFTAGGTDYVTKPFEMLEVKARVRSLLKAKIYNDYMADYQKTLEQEVATRTQQLRVANDQIGKSFIETVYRLAVAAEFKDADTGAHILRIGRYASTLAAKLVQDEEYAESLLYAAPLHDIGKIGVPDHILMNPGKLTEEEWVVMRQHTTIGAAILENSRSKILNLGRMIALTHHEKWDGTGYPMGMQKEAIPLCGRITGIVDVFDALISRRCYKEPIPVETALDIIEKDKGRHFDPKVVQALLESVGDFLAIRETFQDGDKTLLARHFNDILTISPQEQVLLNIAD